MSGEEKKEVVEEEKTTNEEVPEDQEPTDVPEGELEDFAPDTNEETADSKKTEAAEEAAEEKPAEAPAENDPDASADPDDQLTKDDSDDDVFKDATDLASKRMGTVAEEEPAAEQSTPETEQNAEQAARVEADERSVFVKNVHFNATTDELVAFFQEHTSGKVVRVTLVRDKFTHAPTGNAYVEFESQESVEAAIAMNGFDFKGRKIEVKNKRTNIHNFGGRGGRRDRMGRGGFMPYGYPPYMPFGYPPYPMPYPRGRGGYRGH